MIIKMIYVFIIGMSLTLSTDSYYHRNIPSHERQALHDLYAATNGDDWIYLDGDQGHWNFTDPDANPCLSSDPWQGLNCTVISSDSSSSNYYYISEITLSDVNLRGTIPESIGNFTYLIEIDMSLNSLQGTLPHSIYQLSNLQELNLDSNELNGTVSSSIGQLTNLQYLILRFNQFDGTLPSTIGNLFNLTYLALSKNEFYGSIPESLRKVTALTYLSIDSNRFDGTIPHWIGDLYRLSYIDLDSNLFTTGTIPSSISELSLLSILSISNDRLIGTLPSTMSKLSSLTLLSLGINQLHGSIPMWINQLIYLKDLYLNSNQFTGTIPSTLSQLTEIEQYDFSYNLLVGSLLSDNLLVGSFSGLNSIQVENNYLTGTLPIVFSQLPALSRLFVQDNYLGGNLDKVFNGSFQRNLNNVQLSNNQFTGELPKQLFLSSSLVAVSAVSNCFHGTIPSTICLNKKLETLALDGLVCASSCRQKILPGISTSYISDHKITGRIPDCLWSLPNLQVLHMSGNSLTGSLPSNSVTLSNALVDLSLSYNLLSGSIPEFIQDNYWNNLDLSHNRLTGTLTSTFNSTSSSSTLSLNNNRLSGFIPTKIHDMINIDILEGNYFDCKYDRNDLPSKDKNKDTYDCGSNLVEVLCFIWLGLVVISLIFILVFWFDKDRFEFISNIYQWLSIATSLNVNDEVVKNKLESMVHLQRFIATHEMIGRFGVYCIIFIICILLPIYGTLSIFYHTHRYEYAWTIALINLSSKVAFGVTCSVLMIFIITQIIAYIWTAKRNSFYTLFNKIAQIQHQSTERPIVMNSSTIWYVYTAYITINLIVVTGVNMLYVLAVLYGNGRAVILSSQILLSIFKLMWNNGISPTMVRWIVYYLSITTIEAQSTLFFLQFVISIFNNIIIPCLTIMIISPNCLYNAFHQGSDVRSIFHYTNCQILNSDGTCYEYVTYNSTTTYSPPFTYSFQCSSAFIEYYAPVFVFVCIFSTFIIPFSQVLWIRWKLPNIFQFGNLFYPTYGGDKASILVNIDEVYKLLVIKLSFIGLIMTFGTVFPPLAVALLVAIICQSYYHQAVIGRFLTHVVDLKAYFHLDMLEDNLKVQPLLSTIQKCGWFLLYVSCCFYTLFLFDILGDDVGFNGAYWVLIVIPCIPLCMQIAIRVYLHYFIVKRKKNILDHRSDDAIQLSSALSFALNPMANDVHVTVAAADRDSSNSSIIDISALDRHGESIINNLN